MYMRANAPALSLPYCPSLSPSTVFLPVVLGRVRGRFSLPLKSKTIQRYFIIDDRTRTMQIFQKNDPKSANQIVLYSDILQVKEKYQNPGEIISQEKWSFQFSLRCRQRTYELFAVNYYEGRLWLYAFKKICNSGNKQSDVKSKQMIKQTEKDFAQLDSRQKT